MIEVPGLTMVCEVLCCAAKLDRDSTAFPSPVWFCSGFFESVSVATPRQIRCLNWASYMSRTSVPISRLAI